MPRVDLLVSAHSSGRPGTRENDDAWISRQFQDGSWLVAVADGVGSAAAGGEAARRAVEMLADYFAARPPAWTPRRALVDFLQRINRQLHQESTARFSEAQLLTTISAVVVAEGRMYCANLGDSPVFLCRDRRLQELTQAHQAAEAGAHRQLTRALGMAEDAAPHFVELDLEPGDRVLLCTDGVTDSLGRDRLLLACDRQSSARSLVTDARSAVSSGEQPDDATAIILEVTARDDGPSSGQVLEVLPKLVTGEAFPDGTLVQPLDDAARVWLAETTEGHRVLLKFPPLEAGTDDVRAEAFLRESWLAARMEGAAFVRARIPAGPVLRYYVQDYVAAPTLREILRRGPLPVEGALALARCLTDAVQLLAQRDLAHGDLKPDNLLVEAVAPGWQFRLVDAGSVAGLFSVTSRAGTPSYLAPERFQGAPISERTEIFSIGVILHEALTGRLPFGEIERFQTPRFGRPRPISSLNPTVPPWLDAIVQRSVCPKAEERYQHLSELAHDLEHPEQVRPFHDREAPLLERNPLRFYQILALLLLALNLLQLFLGLGRQ